MTSYAENLKNVEKYRRQKREQEIALAKIKEEGLMKRHVTELAQRRELAKPETAYWNERTAAIKRTEERDIRESGPPPRDIEIDESGYLPTIRNVPTKESTPAPTVAVPGTQDFVGPMQRRRSGSTGSIDVPSIENYSTKLPEVPYSVRRKVIPCLLYTSPSPRDGLLSRMPSSA